ncbi:hypothetical protein LZ32DRAFT_63091 [Colletotrichum eremochloae]|nr:hypothetical protein LZ32DRAFT_63091 [Colletotrichum eremochloae]
MAPTAGAIIYKESVPRTECRVGIPDTSVRSRSDADGDLRWALRCRHWTRFGRLNRRRCEAVLLTSWPALAKPMTTPSLRCLATLSHCMVGLSFLGVAKLGDG